MSVIGEQIKKYRVERGITQEQLGQLIGVTTQAVSRWERGGTPDAELLPGLSEVLGVSIDALFGREEQSVALSLARQLCRMSREEAFRFAFKICWALELGLLGDLSAVDDFFNRFLENPVITTTQDRDHFARIVYDSGVAYVRMSRDLHHFFLMVEPQEDIRTYLADPGELRRVFEIFADKRMLRIVYYLYAHINSSVATSLISKTTGIGQKEVDSCMDVLCRYNLASRSVIATADGDINSYTFRPEGNALPLLLFADELAKQDFRPFFGSFDRSKPML